MCPGLPVGGYGIAAAPAEKHRERERERQRGGGKNQGGRERGRGRGGKEPGRERKGEGERREGQEVKNMCMYDKVIHIHITCSPEHFLPFSLPPHLSSPCMSASLSCPLSLQHRGLHLCSHTAALLPGLLLQLLVEASESGHVTLLHGQLLGFVVLQTGYPIACKGGRREGKKVGWRKGGRMERGREGTKVGGGGE